MQEDKVILYSYWRSSCSWRVRLALGTKEVDYEYKAVHLVKAEQHDEAYLQVNPSHTVPSLLIDGQTLTQSMAIMEYLEDSRPTQGASLFPPEATPADKALVRRLCLMVACDIQPIQNFAVLKYVGMDRKMEWGGHWIQRGFEALEKVLSTSAGKYCVGDNVTMADMCLVPQVYNARRFQVDMTAFPTITRIDAALSELPIFKAAHPDQQPDAQSPA